MGLYRCKTIRFSIYGDYDCAVMLFYHSVKCIVGLSRAQLQYPTIFTTTLAALIKFLFYVDKEPLVKSGDYNAYTLLTPINITCTWVRLLISIDFARRKRESGRIQGLPNFFGTPYYLRNG